MNKLLKKKKGSKKKDKKNKKNQKKSLFPESKEEKEKKVEKEDVWGDEDEGFIIDYNIKEKTANDNDKPAAINLESGWKDEEIKQKVVEKEETEEKKAGKKKIKWGDGIRETVNLEQTVSDNFFPGLEDREAVKKEMKKKKAVSDTNGESGNGTITRKFFNSKGGVNNNLKNLMQPGGGIQIQRREREREDPNKTLEVKGKVKLKYEKSQQELMMEKMQKEMEERDEQKRGDQGPKRRGFFGNGLRRGGGDRDFDRDRDRDHDRDRDRDRDRDKGDRDGGLKRGNGESRGFRGVEVLGKGQGKSLVLGGDRRDRERRDRNNGGDGGFRRDGDFMGRGGGGGFRDNRDGGGGFRDNRGDGGGFRENRSGGGFGRDNRSGGGFGRDRDRDRDRDNRGFNRESGGGGGLTRGDKPRGLLSRGEGKMRTFGNGTDEAAGKQDLNANGKEVEPIRIKKEPPQKIIAKVNPSTWE